MGWCPTAVAKPVEPKVFMNYLTQFQFQFKQKEVQVELSDEEKAAEIQKQLEITHEQFINQLQQSDVTALDLTIPSGLTTDQANVIIKDTGLEGLGEAFVNAESKYHINAYYLIAHAAWESGWGTSKLAKNKNNLFGFVAYDKTAYSSADSFKTKEECINVVAKFISENYLEENGDYYNGPTLKGMNIKYASDKHWAKGIAETMEGLVNKNESDS